MMKMTKIQSHVDQKEQWQEIKTPSTVINRRSCHSSCIYQDSLYVYGGYDNSASGIFKDFFRYNFEEKEWKEVQASGEPPGDRHSHTSVVYQDKLYLFGGMHEFMANTNKLHVFDFKENSWKHIHTVNTPPSIDSHKCCLYGNQMIMGLGYSEYDHNSNIYSLDLDTLTWKTIFSPPKDTDKTYPKPRTQGSFSLDSDRILIYGGKDAYSTFGDLWSFDLITSTFSQIILNTEMEGRFGHSAVIDSNRMYIFGGTRGVTHERNDLISIDLVGHTITICLADSQEERRNHKEETSNPLLKKSRRDSAKKGINWSHFFPEEQEDEEEQKAVLGKYRVQFKENEYYNSFYNRQQKELMSIKKTKKNPIFNEFKSSSVDMENLSFTSTFQILTNSIMLMSGKPGAKEEKCDQTCEFRKKIPKARDNSTADLRVKDDKLEMVVFGGGMHKIGFNDIINIDLKQVIRKHLSFLEDEDDEEEDDEEEEEEQQGGDE